MMLDPKCEDALNTQANIEMTVSMVYLALHHHFAADAVSLPGLAAHFLKEAGEAAGDSQLMDFVESDFLEDQLNSIKEISDWVTQLRRVGDGQGEFLFDQSLM